KHELPTISMTDPLRARRTFRTGTGSEAAFLSLPALEEEGLGRISRLPVSLRIVLESVLRNVDGLRIKEEDVRRLALWQPEEERTAEIPVVVARIVLQDFTGVRRLVDLAAMRSAVARRGKDRARVEPLLPAARGGGRSVQGDGGSPR